MIGLNRTQGDLQTSGRETTDSHYSHYRLWLIKVIVTDYTDWSLSFQAQMVVMLVMLVSIAISIQHSGLRTQEAIRDNPLHCHSAHFPLGPGACHVPCIIPLMPPEPQHHISQRLLTTLPTGYSRVRDRRMFLRGSYQEQKGILIYSTVLSPACQHPSFHAHPVVLLPWLPIHQANVECPCYETYDINPTMLPHRPLAPNLLTPIWTLTREILKFSKQ